MNQDTTGVENLRPMEREAILDWMLYTMSQDTRAKLMERFPAQYNAMYGREIMGISRPV